MTLYTSYFAQLRNFPPNLVGLSTAVWEPKWLQPGKDKNGAIWLPIPPLKPGKFCDGLCNGKCNPKHPQDCSFLKEYRKQLDQISFEDFLRQLLELRDKICAGEHLDDIDFALLVYETPQNPCSERVVIQQWFKDHGMEIEEWQKLKS